MYLKKMSHNYFEIYEDSEAKMLQDADNAITECNLWEWLKEFTPKENEGFMFSNHENLNLIHSKMKLIDYHSGSSYGWTMRQMEYVAKNGWDKYYTKRKSKLTPACKCRKDEGYRFGWCGVAGGGVPGCDH